MAGFSATLGGSYGTVTRIYLQAPLESAVFVGAHTQNCKANAAAMAACKDEGTGVLLASPGGCLAP